MTLNLRFVLHLAVATTLAIFQLSAQSESDTSNAADEAAADTRQAGTPTPAIAPTDLDQKLSQAQERVAAGKRLLQEGNREGARQAFDRAIDLLLKTTLGPQDRVRAERSLEELVDLIYRYDVDELGSGESPDKVVYEKAPLDEIRDLNFPVNPDIKGLVRQQVTSTASQLPLELNDTVLGFINYFTTTKVGRNTLVNGWRRSGRYRPMIERILGEVGVPQELIFLAQAESGFLPRAISRKAAAGMWQFVSWRGKEYGLDQSSLYDLRLDPERATRAAAEHLKDLYDQFGDWHLALAAYNCGPGCVDRGVQRTGYADYWELRRRNAIPHETTNYVPIIMAMTIVTRNAKDYGIVLDDPAPSLDYDRLTVKSNTNIDLIADAADLPVSAIRDLNPALLKHIAPAGFEVRVPKGQSTEIAEAIDRVPSEERAAWRLHRVKPGESLTEIAQRYRTTGKLILAANGDGQPRLEAGDVLIVPAAYVDPAPKRTVSSRNTRRTPAAQSARKPARPVYRTSGKRAAAR